MQLLTEPSVSLFQALFFNSQDIVMILDRNAQILNINRVEEGFTIEETIGTCIYDWFTQVDELAHTKNVIHHVFTKRAKGTYYLTVTSPMGETMYHEIAVSPVVLDGAVPYALAIARNIKPLIDNEQNLDRITKALPILLLVFNENGRYIDVLGNKNLLVYGGSEELVGRTVHEMLPQDKADLFLEKIQETLKINQTITFEYTFAKKDKTIWLRAKSSVVPEAFGNGRKVLFACEDITEAKAAQAKVEQVIEELTSTNKALEQFAYAASHDLQEPLNTVANYVHLVLEEQATSLNEDGQEFLQYAYDATQRLKSLTEGLLTFSRFRHMELTTEQIDCNQLVAGAINNLQSQIERNQAIITHDLNNIKIIGHRLLLTQLMQNLIGNAIKFRQKNVSPQIHVTVEENEADWQFAVRDNGIGLEESHFERIFGIFRRLHIQTEYEGTGIGLALCKQIVQRHGGKIWIESNLGAGSTFYFTIPRE